MKELMNAITWASTMVMSHFIHLAFVSKFSSVLDSSCCQLHTYDEKKKLQRALDLQLFEKSGKLSKNFNYWLYVENFIKLWQFEQNRRQITSQNGLLDTAAKDFVKNSLVSIVNITMER